MSIIHEKDCDCQICFMYKLIGPLSVEKEDYEKLKKFFTEVVQPKE